MLRKGLLAIKTGFEHESNTLNKWSTFFLQREFLIIPKMASILYKVVFFSS